MTRRMRFWEDATVARKLGRFTWVVIVAAFVIGTRFEARDPGLRLVVPIALGVAVALMSAPTALGLYHTRAQASLRAYRLVALSLVARILATVWVIWLLLP